VCEKLTHIPISIPDAVLKKTWRKKKMYKKANARGLTNIELAELKRATEIKRGKARATIPGDFKDVDEEGFLIPDLPLPARTSES
jgi:hypothetical protein